MSEDRCGDAHTDVLKWSSLVMGFKEEHIFIDCDSSHCDTEKAN